MGFCCSSTRKEGSCMSVGVHLKLNSNRSLARLKTRLDTKDCSKVCHELSRHFLVMCADSYLSGFIFLAVTYH